MSQLSAMLDHREGPDSFLDAETATFASRIKRLIKTKADELQQGAPRGLRGSDSGACMPLMPAALASSIDHRAAATSATRLAGRTWGHHCVTRCQLAWPSQWVLHIRWRLTGKLVTV